MTKYQKVIEKKTIRCIIREHVQVAHKHKATNRSTGRGQQNRDQPKSVLLLPTTLSSPKSCQLNNSTLTKSKSSDATNLQRGFGPS